MSLDIKGIDQPTLLATLYNEARPLGMGMLHFDPALMTRDEAAKILETRTSFDYLKGRPLKIRFDGDTLHGERLYDRDQGEGHCAEVVERLRPGLSEGNGR
jgi:hypothetical protein